jgi:hypothetical protein
MEYDIRLEHHAGQPLAVVRRRASPQDLATVIPAACGTVWAVLRAQQTPGAGRLVAVYWDGQINVEVGAEVAAPFAGHGEVVGSATASGPVVTTTHYGPYSRLHEAHEAIRRWCAGGGRRLAGSSWPSLRPSKSLSFWDRLWPASVGHPGIWLPTRTSNSVITASSNGMPAMPSTSVSARSASAVALGRSTRLFSALAPRWPRRRAAALVVRARPPL